VIITKCQHHLESIYSYVNSGAEEESRFKMFRRHIAWTTVIYPSETVRTEYLYPCFPAVISSLLTTPFIKEQEKDWQGEKPFPPP
jgi:hypothetical protein